MKIDEDMQLFFDICGLDWRNFNFEDLVKGYKNSLFLIADNESKYYMDMDLLGFIVNSFSRILETFFEVSQYSDEEIYTYSTNRVVEVWEKSNRYLGEKYTDQEMIMGLSFMITHMFVEVHNVECGFEKEMLTFSKMVDNFYYIEKICESVDKKFDDVQKGIGVMPS